MFQILIKDREGHDVLLPEQMSEEQADLFVERLTNSGIKADKVFREDKKYQVVTVIYKPADIHDKTKWRTYVDPDEIAKEGDIVLLQNTDATTSEATVIKVEKQTLEWIRKLCDKIHYRKLGKVIKLVWSPKRK